MKPHAQFCSPSGMSCVGFDFSYVINLEQSSVLLEGLRLTSADSMDTINVLCA